MNGVPREKLREIIVTYGQAVCDDVRRCEGLLKDYCGEYKREVNALVSALRERVPGDLLSSGTSVPIQVTLAQLANRLEEDLGLSEQVSRWAVESWAFALGLITSVTPEAPDSSAVPSQPTIQAAPTGPQTIIVSKAGRGQYTSINEAIRNAQPGATIMVQPGVYKESVVIDREVQIVGDGPVERIVIEAVDTSSLIMQTSTAEVRGLTIRNVSPSKSDTEFSAVDIPQGQLVLADCDISSSISRAIGVHGSTAKPTIRWCRIHDSVRAGIRFWEGASGIVEDCDIYGNISVGAAVGQMSNPTLRRCKIHDGQDTGFFVEDGGMGLLEDCDIYGNANSCVWVQTEGNPTLRRCKIHNGKQEGVFVQNQGASMLEDCDIYANAYVGVDVRTGGNPMLRRCKIHDGMQGGVWVYERGVGVFEDCDIHGNVVAGVQLTTNGNPTLRGCKIHNDKEDGILVNDQGAGMIENCDIYNNTRSGVEIKEGGNPIIRGCRINSNKEVAIYVHDRGRGTVEDCDLIGNYKGAWEISSGCSVKRNRNRDR